MKLIIENSDAQGKIKTWQLDQTSKAYTIGSSVESDILIAHSSVPNFLGVLEYKDNSWNFVDFRPQTLLQTKPPLFRISEPTCLDLGDQKISLKTLEQEVELFSETTQQIDATLQKGLVQVVILSKNGVRLSIDAAPLGQNWSSPYLGSSVIIKMESTQSWKTNEIEGFTIAQKTYSLNSKDLADILRANAGQEKEQKSLLLHSSIGIALLTSAIVTSFFFGRNSEEVPVLSQHQMIQEFQIPKTLPKKQEKKSAAAPAAASKVAASNPPTAAARPTTGSRITQLIGKISNSKVKSKNIIVGKGSETGMAVSSIDNLRSAAVTGQLAAQSGTIGVSTAGVGGGKAISGIGTVAGAKAGGQGVGLIEEEGEVSGGLDREVIAAYIRQQIGQILYCYERQLSASPDLFGKLAVRFTIKADGRVDSQKIGESTLKNASVEGCVLSKVGQWKFPIPEGGTQVIVTYPFFFKSTN